MSFIGKLFSSPETNDASKKTVEENTIAIRSALMNTLKNYPGKEREINISIDYRGNHSYLVTGMLSVLNDAFQEIDPTNLIQRVVAGALKVQRDSVQVGIDQNIYTFTTSVERPTKR